MKTCLRVLMLLPLFPVLLFSQENPPPAEAPVDVMPVVPVEDPFASAPPEPGGVSPVRAARLKEERPAVLFRVEVWEIPALDFIRHLDAGSSAADIAKWREAWLAAKDGPRLILSPSANLNSATKVADESITEFIYPTEYDEGGGLPSSPPPEGKGEERKEVLRNLPMGWALSPTAFETRNTGDTLEATAWPVEVAKDTWDVSFILEKVAAAGMRPYGLPEFRAEMPFFTSFRTTTLVRLQTGRWKLISQQTPPQGMESKTLDKRWVTLVRIDPN